MTTERATSAPSNPLTALLTHKAFIVALRLFLGSLFLYSSIHKVQSPDAFAVAIRGYQFLPIGLTNVFALFVAWSEAVAGILLILGVMTRQAAAAVLLLLVMFVVAIGTTLIRGIAVDCGCFSNEGGHVTGAGLLVRNLFLITAAAMVVQYDRGTWSLAAVFSKKRA
jgi:uncharacterized membrane protein YphA (DoxX/SURF4 family)